MGSGGKIFKGAIPGFSALSDMISPKPKMPKAEDPAEQQRRAEAEAKAKLDAEIMEKGKGLSATILGGTTSDDTVLKKKKLLGQ